MTRRTKVWFALAIVFLAINVFGGLYALALGELGHGLLHAVLAVPAFLVVRRMARSGRGASAAPALDAAPSELTERLSQLEQSVDSVALEIERIGEGQRYVAKLFAEREGAPVGADVQGSREGAIVEAPPRPER